MKIAYNPKTAAALTTAPANNDITFDLSGLSIYVKGVRFKGTDTTYSVFKKHGSSGGGYDGLVPVPSYNNDSKNRYLREDGTWQQVAVTDQNVLQSETTATQFRPIVLGLTYDASASNLAKSVTGQVYVTTKMYAQPSTGYLYASKLFSGGKEVLTSHQSLANYVTLNTNQTITGVKTFSTQQKFTVGQGTSPFTVTSTTKVTNLNADLLDGLHSSSFSLAGHTHNYLSPVASIGGSSKTHAEALKDQFTNNKSNIPRNVLINYYSSSYSNGSQYFGYFINGYDSNPYGGFYIAHYNTPYYVGIQNGVFTQWALSKVGHTHAGLTFKKTDGTNVTYDGSTAIDLSSGIYYSNNSGYATRLDGGATASWGTLTTANGYTGIAAYDWGTKGAFAWAGKGGQMSMQIDGFFYQNEGKYRVLDTSDKGGLFTSFINAGSQTTSITIGGTTRTLKIDSDTVDGWHASEFTKFYISPLSSNAPADSAKTWFINTMPSGMAAIVYNVPGSEKTIIVGKSTGPYGHMLQLSYDDRYLRLLRYKAGNWQSTDWEKIYAGYADSAGTTQNIRIDQYSSTGDYPVIWADSASSNANSNTISRLYKTWKSLYWTPNTATLTSGRLWLSQDSDVSNTSNTGSLVIGPSGGTQIGIDGNEIIARNGNSAATLYLQNEGGQICINNGGTAYNLNVGGTSLFTNTMHITSGAGNYCEGIRIERPDSTFATIILGATSSSGTNANAWSIHRKADNNFCISRNSSDGTNGLVMTSAGMGLGTTSPAYRLHVSGTTYTSATIGINRSWLDNGQTSTVGPIVMMQAIKGMGYPVYGDPEFANGSNSVSVYNNSSNGTVTINRIVDNQTSSNSSGYILQISTSTGTASPGRGGFVQHIPSRANAVFVQIFRAKIPIGFSVVNAENSQGSGATFHWLTSREGTGKWEWYIRVTHCGSSGSFSDGGHVYLSGSGAVTWYLSYCNLIDITKGNYDGLRTRYSDTATYVNNTYVMQHTSNNTEYPLIWSNQNNTNSVQGNQLHKSYSHLTYNPSQKRVIAGQFYANNAAGPHFTGVSTSGNWAYLRLNNSTCYWDIATRNNSGSGGLWLSRYNGEDNGIFVSTGSNVGISTSSPSYKLHAVGDTYATGWSRSGNGFYCENTGVHFTHQGSIGEIDMTSNNEFLWGSSGSTLYFNYRGVSRGTTVTNYIWNAGSSTSYASHTLGGLTSRGSQELWGLTSTCNSGNTSTGPYNHAAVQIREYNFGGTQSDTWGNAPRLAWHWQGRVAAQIGLASNGYLYTAPLTNTNWYKLVYESGTWGINISGTAADSDKLDGLHVDQVSTYTWHDRRVLDLRSYDSSKWYPCWINGSASYSRQRISIRNALNGNKPSWATHRRGFSLIAEIWWVPSGWGTLSGLMGLEHYEAGFGGETAFGGVQQNTMQSTLIIWLRGGGYYYYWTSSRESALSSSTSGYSWVSGTYSYSASPRTSQGSPYSGFNCYTLAYTNQFSSLFSAFSGGGISSSGNTITQANHSITVGGTTRTAGSSSCNIINSLSVSKATSSATTNLTLGITINGIVSSDKTITNLHATCLNNTYVSNPASASCTLNKQGVQWFSQINTSSGYAGNNYGFPVSNNANGILYLGTHPNGTSNAYYAGQIGISSNGRLYYRFNNGSTWSTTANGGSWRTVAWTTDTMSYITVTNSDSNSTYRMVWHSGSSLYSTGGIYCNPSTDWLYATSMQTSSWFRSTGQTGWYNSTYGGGIYMSDSTYVRVYNGKYLYTTYQYYDVGNQDYTIDHVYASNDRYIRPMAWSTFLGKIESSHDSRYLRRYSWWNSGDTHNVNDLRGGTTFAYTKHSAPANGTIVAFDCSTNQNYTLQIMGQYNGENLYFRNRNGDNGSWYSWRAVRHSGSTYVYSNKGYIGGTEITYVNSAGTASKVTVTDSSTKYKILGANGTGSQSIYRLTATIGGAAKPIYISGGVPTECSSTVGSGIKPVYMSSGTITASSSTVGSSAAPIYLSSGTITASSYSFCGKSTQPVVLAAGYIYRSSATENSDNWYFSGYKHDYIDSMNTTASISGGVAKFTFNAATGKTLRFITAIANHRTSKKMTSATSGENSNVRSDGLWWFGSYANESNYVSIRACCNGDSNNDSTQSHSGAWKTWNGAILSFSIVIVGYVY